MPIRITQESLAVQRRRLETERPPSAWLRELEALRPKTRGDCVNNGLRPCPFLACKYNLRLETYPAGRLRVLDGLVELDGIQESCVLDVADRHLGDGITLEAIAGRVGICRERANQIVRKGMGVLKGAMAEEKRLEAEEEEGEAWRR